MTANAPRVYIHGESDAEAERLLAQAQFLAPFVFDNLALDGVESLLEVGIGVGAETRLLRARWPALRVTGIDLSAHQLRHARVTLRDELAAGTVRLVRGSATQLPIADRAVDGALLIWVLEHVPDPARVVAECARVLKPRGRLFATEVYNVSLRIEPRHPVLESYWAAMCELQARSGGHPDVGARLPELVTAAGLEVTKFRFIPTLGDARDPERRSALIRYFEGIFRSTAPQLAAAGAFPVEKIADVWRAFDDVVAAPDALLCYTGAQIEARKP